MLSFEVQRSGPAGPTGSSGLASRQRDALPMLRSARRTLAFGLLAVLASASSQPAKAINIQSFDLRWDLYTSGGPIFGKIVLDLDGLATDLPYVNTTALPPWLIALSIDIPGPGPGTGKFTKADYIGLDWNNDAGTVSFDFTEQLIGQNGWGTTCTAPYQGVCSFGLKRDPNGANAMNALYGVVGFDIYTLLDQPQYGRLNSFAPSAVSAVPGPLPIAGLAALLPFSRRLRRRPSGVAASGETLRPR